MKIQLDTTSKTIKIEEPVLLADLVSTLESMLPDDAWQEFKLETNTIVNWTNPIIYPAIRPIVDPIPWNVPWITYEDNRKYQINSGVYCVEIGKVH